MAQLCAAVAALTTIVLVAAPAHAIVGGTTDGTNHSYVAAIGQPDGGGIVFTGVAISPTVVLTVAHGAARLERATGSDQARVTFDSVADSSATWYTGTIHIDPNWDPRIGIGINDLAVITFASPLPVTPATLPMEGQLDQLGQARLLTYSYSVVGYGLTSFTGATNVGGQPIPDFTSGGTRKVDGESFLSFDPDWAWFKMPDGDQLCPGDSGSPTLLGNSSLIVGISLGGVGGIESSCVSSSSVTDIRVDSPAARSFIGRYVSLP
jgi:hypothetical protein